MKKVEDLLWKDKPVEGVVKLLEENLIKERERKYCISVSWSHFFCLFQFILNSDILKSNILKNLKYQADIHLKLLPLPNSYTSSSPRSSETLKKHRDKQLWKNWRILNDWPHIVRITRDAYELLQLIIQEWRSESEGGWIRKSQGL